MINMLKKILILFFPIILFSQEYLDKLFDLDFWNYNAGITLNFGDSYDDFTYMENRMDLNFFKGNFTGWLQYESWYEYLNFNIDININIHINILMNPNMTS